jgi:hypothetical protein
MEGLDEWLPPALAGTETGLQTAQVILLFTVFVHTKGMSTSI